mmetsp:Transcript_101348/g.292039  ORF Transcript_101348/g.292039 Transcript_101348/m.292039 type:complete len:253 (+) Transcript_101348:447-1205(+)
MHATSRLAPAGPGAETPAPAARWKQPKAYCAPAALVALQPSQGPHAPHQRPQPPRRTCPSTKSGPPPPQQQAEFLQRPVSRRFLHPNPVAAPSSPRGCWTAASAAMPPALPTTPSHRSANRDLVATPVRASARIPLRRFSRPAAAASRLELRIRTCPPTRAPYGPSCARRRAFPSSLLVVGASPRLCRRALGRALPQHAANRVAKRGALRRGFRPAAPAFGSPRSARRSWSRPHSPSAYSCQIRPALLRIFA